MSTSQHDHTFNGLRVLCRVLAYDPKTGRVLLVRNRNQSWWCAPGGSWNHSSESLVEAAAREVFEETGIGVNIGDLVAVQTLDISQEGSVWLELFWRATPSGTTDIPQGHIDHYGVVDEARWFTEAELQALKIYPVAIKEGLWEAIVGAEPSHRAFLGAFTV